MSDESALRDAIDALPPLKEIVAAHDLIATKKLGQNFLFDQNITDKIVRYAGDLSGKTVFEIGPGPGGLTRSILRAGASKVIAIEFDERAILALESLKAAADGRLDVLHLDALSADLLSLCDGPRVIIANLPYNIATPLLTGWLKQIYEHGNAFDEMILMFQKEVAQRITADMGDKNYGRLGILSNWLCDTSILFDLPPSVFAPPPKVTSSVVKFARKKEIMRADYLRFHHVEKATESGFGKRRKMIRQSMKEYMPYIEELGINETLRAENLSVAQFIEIARLKAGFEK